jgi:Acetyltransferases, including N-acetylases of ribosomal proteins
MLLELQPLTDIGTLDEIYRDPYIARVGHDHRPAAPVIHPAAHYLGAYADGQLVGSFLVIESGFIETDVHALLTRRALPHSRELGRMCLHYIFFNPSIERITAYVIDGLTAARNYCLKLGFKSEGFRRAACVQNGVLLGIHTMGMTRNDWKESQ